VGKCSAILDRLYLKGALQMTATILDGKALAKKTEQELSVDPRGNGR